MSRSLPPTLPEYFEAVQALIAKLERDGQVQAAHELREGYGCLNGLTDGWALFLESVERVRKSRSNELGKEDQDTLKMIRTVAYKAVYRR